MLRRTFAHLSYANVVATIALFSALGGSSYAAVQLSRDSVRSGHIKNGQIKTVDVADGSLRTSDLNKGDAADMKNDVRVTRLRGREASFVQQADEVVELVGQATVTPPAGCEGSVGIEIVLDDVVLLSGYSSTSTTGTRNVALTIDETGGNLLFEPGADTTRKIEVRVDDGCADGDWDIGVVAIDVLRYR
jgi:hypothetical protein